MANRAVEEIPEQQHTPPSKYQPFFNFQAAPSQSFKSSMAQSLVWGKCVGFLMTSCPRSGTAVCSWAACERMVHSSQPLLSDNALCGNLAVEKPKCSRFLPLLQLFVVPHVDSAVHTSYDCKRQHGEERKFVFVVIYSVDIAFGTKNESLVAERNFGRCYKSSFR